MADRAADPAEATRLLDQIVQQAEEWKKGTPGAREELISSVILLRPALSTPTENLVFHSWASTTHLSTMRTATETNLFEALATSGKSPQNAAQIAEKTQPKLETSLVGRMLRNMASMGTVKETDADAFVSTPFSLAMCREAFKDSLWFMWDYFTPALLSAHHFIVENGTPASNSYTPWHKAYDAPRGPIWAHWPQHEPHVATRFANFMQVYGEGRPFWFQDGYYPVRERLIAGADTSADSVFLVDIGAGSGHDATRLLAAMASEIPGQIVIQDRPEVIEIAKKEAASQIVKQPHDFFTEEPVKGARAYFLHSIIHDWPDAEAQQILKSIVPAMKPGYSKILICDCVIEDKGGHWFTTAMDLMMMTALAARERTRSEFNELAKTCGLKVTNVFSHVGGWDSIVEMELA